MSSDPPKLPGPPHELSRLVVAAFLLIQCALLLQCTLSLVVKVPWTPRWPWGMFSHHGPEERRLEALGFTASGERVPIPLAELFTYSRGFTSLRSYDQTDIFDKPEKAQQRQAFVRFLAQKLKMRGVVLTRIEFAWRTLLLDRAAEERRPIGDFPVEAAP